MIQDLDETHAVVLTRAFSDRSLAKAQGVARRLERLGVADVELHRNIDGGPANFPVMRKFVDSGQWATGKPFSRKSLIDINISRGWRDILEIALAKDTFPLLVCEDDLLVMDDDAFIRRTVEESEPCADIYVASYLLKPRAAPAETKRRWMADALRRTYGEGRPLPEPFTHEGHALFALATPELARARGASMTFIPEPSGAKAYLDAITAPLRDTRYHYVSIDVFATLTKFRNLKLGISSTPLGCDGCVLRNVKSEHSGHWNPDHQFCLKSMNVTADRYGNQ